MKTKNAVLNFITDSIPEIIIIFLGLIKIKYFLQYLGEETLGLYQLYGQFFAYITLAEAGLSTASLYALYKPIANKEEKHINELLSGINRIFKIIGISMIIIGLGISFIIPFFIKNNIFNLTYIQITFMLFLLANVFSYFYKPYYIYYDVKQKKYIPNLISQIGMIVKFIIEIVLIIMKFNLTTILIVSAIITLLTNISLKYKGKNDYPLLNLKTKKDYSMLKNTKDLLFHRIGGLVANNIDIVLISKFIGLGQVVIYSAYNYIISSLTSIVGKISTSLYTVLGNTIITESKEKNYQIFLEINNFLCFLGTLIGGALMFSINPFIKVFYGSNIVAGKIIALFFVLIIFIRIIMSSVNTYCNSAGLFKQTIICTVTESIINLSLSLLLITKYKMMGVLFGTIISYIVSNLIIKPRILYKNIFPDIKLKKYYTNLLVSAMFFTIVVFINSQIPFTSNSIIMWFILSVIVFIINSLFIYIFYKLIKRDNWMYRFLNILKLKKIK